MVSAMIAGRTITFRYQSRMRISPTAAAQARSLHAQPAARSTPAGTGGILTVET
jgi:hypothetical protein